MPDDANGEEVTFPLALELLSESEVMIKAPLDFSADTNRIAKMNCPMTFPTFHERKMEIEEFCDTLRIAEGSINMEYDTRSVIKQQMDLEAPASYQRKGALEFLVPTKVDEGQYIHFEKETLSNKKVSLDLEAQTTVVFGYSIEFEKDGLLRARLPINAMFGTIFKRRKAISFEAPSEARLIPYNRLMNIVKIQ